MWRLHYSGPATWRSKHIELADVTVYQGGQATDEDRCGEAPKPAEVANAKAPILDSVWAKAAGITTIGVITCWALCRGTTPSALPNHSAALRHVVFTIYSCSAQSLSALLRGWSGIFVRRCTPFRWTACPFRTKSWISAIWCLYYPPRAMRCGVHREDSKNTLTGSVLLDPP